ncbi:MAG: hypothetical protein IPM45_16695 [Acidimicrobiales bacterium]|nr:hypothetical protein [Acidimicrobiales bacterium]
MTTTYDPFHPRYFDEADLREELTRVYDLCHGCRLCFKFCSAFPTLFEMIDAIPEQDSARLSPAQQDQVVDECFNCKLCYINCPYIPGQHEWELDFPRLMLRAEAVRHRNKEVPLRERVTDGFLARTDLLGRVSVPLSGVVNASTGTPGSFSRRMMEKVVGVASQRLLPPFAKQRFSTWFRKRARPVLGRKQAEVALFPTCLVEYQAPSVGKDVVRVYERNGVEVDLPETVCCGAPWLHAGDVDSFVKQGRKNVEVLARAVREGKDVVVPQPTCGFVLKKDYPDYVGGPDAQLVAEHTYDAAEYLIRLHKGEGTELDTEFPGTIPETITYHAPCHLRSQGIGLKSRDLMKLTGARIQIAEGCSGIDGTWGYREKNYELAKDVARKLGAAIDKQAADVVAGDCHLANGSITEETGRVPMHPISVVARAYGIPEEA